MNPNENLDQQLEIAKRFREGREQLSDDSKLAELVEALDGWLTGNGEMPLRWTKKPERIRCAKCGKSVSTLVPANTVIRACVQCPECIEKEAEQER